MDNERENTFTRHYTSCNNKNMVSTLKSLNSYSFVSQFAFNICSEEEEYIFRFLCFFRSLPNVLINFNRKSNLLVWRNISCRWFMLLPKTLQYWFLTLKGSRSTRLLRISEIEQKIALKPETNRAQMRRSNTHSLQLDTKQREIKNPQHIHFHGKPPKVNVTGG